MGKWIRGEILLFFIFFVYTCVCDSQEQPLNTYTISSISYAKTLLRPYDWRYIRVELPPWFSSMSLSLESDADIDLREVNDGSSVPIICFREGSPPLPDVHNTSAMGLVVEYISNDSFVASQSLQNHEKCYPMQKNISLSVTNEQISPGTWFFGLFNGIGPVRTQSKMINRGSEYSFSGNISVEGCMMPTMRGQFCNQTVTVLSCGESYNLTKTGLRNGLYQGIGNNTIACRNANGIVCHEEGPNTYILDVEGIVDEIFVAATNLTVNGTKPSNTTGNLSLMCYARHGASSLKTVYDFSVDLRKAPLVIKFPKAGRWYITIQPVYSSNKSGTVPSNSSKACYLLVWQMNQCPLGKAGFNCTSERHSLQTILRKNPAVPFESSYMPKTADISTNSDGFPLEPLQSNFSSRGNSDSAWTFFLVDLPNGATGGNIHIQLSGSLKINYEIYARYGGLPSLHNWDYYYANSTSSSNGSMFFKLYDSSEETINFYMFYVRGGTWAFGLRQLNPTDSNGKTIISFSLERCPNKCSSHGQCQSVLDTSGLTLFSYCGCDVNHGGFDCSIELVSHRGHVIESIFLVASNAAALLPAYWSLHNKAFAEWVLYTSSGISSALYHSCDVGTWCILPFHVLQFMDFWLSFMAVVSTFVYLTTISEVSKRTIHMVIAIVTALMAETGATRSKNITYVLGLGTAGLLVGWGLEFCASNRTFSFTREFHFDLLARWESIKQWFRNIMKTIMEHFRWRFIIAGFVALAMAAVSWNMESSKSYWMWHSLWHVSIYTSSFLFLCSKANGSTCEDERSSNGAYELTRQNSFNRDDQRLER